MIINETLYSEAIRCFLWVLYMDKTKLKLIDCKKEYKTGTETVKVLNGVNLEVYEDEFVIILGESGCGKTTLLNILGGIDAMDEGKLFYEDEDLSASNKEQLTRFRREHVGFVFQESNLMPNLTALENVQMVATLNKNSLDPVECLEMVGLKDRMNHFPTALSLGQRQRVAIARAIVKAPDVIIADEPTASLDPKTGMMVLDVLAKIVKDRHITVVMTTHDVEFSKLADRVVVLEDGML